MEKLDLKTPNFTNENIEKIAELFPNCVTEKNNESGEIERSIDFDSLRQELSDSIVEGSQERYNLNWPGKREALVTANTPISKTLRPCREESVDFDNTKNIFIEGDNLDALKLLQETYLNKIKMIYIDPPYNTGKDFIYKDNFTVDRKEYDEASGQRDEEGGRLVANPDSNGRYHSDWLSMMYPRLKLARNLLCDDGVIFISIDDNEIENLIKISKEIFGDDCLKTIAVKMSESSGLKMASVKKNGTIPKLKEYVVVIKKDGINNLFIQPIAKDKWDSEYNVYLDGLTEVGRSTINKIRVKGNVSEADLILLDSIVSKIQIKTVSEKLKEENILSVDKDSWRFKNSWKICQSTTSASVLKLANIKRQNNQNHLFFVISPTGLPYLVKAKYDLASRKPRLQLIFADDNLTYHPGDFWNHIRTTGLDNEGGVPYKNGKKPQKLLNALIEAKADMEGQIIIDFFSGSSSTAEAVLNLSANDQIKRRFIMVQLAENLDESYKNSPSSEGKKSLKESIDFLSSIGKPHVLTELGKERIRRAGKKIKKDNADQEGIENLDTGFRVFKIDSTNMVDVQVSPDDASPDMFAAHVDNIKKDRSSEDLLFQVLLDWGVDLSLPIIREEIGGKEVFFVDGDALAACFDKGINEEFVTELATRKPLRVVFRDDGFGSGKDGDSVKINVEQVFKLKSPATDIKVI